MKPSDTTVVGMLALVPFESIVADGNRMRDTSSPNMAVHRPQQAESSVVFPSDTAIIEVTAIDGGGGAADNVPLLPHKLW